MWWVHGRPVGVWVVIVAVVIDALGYFRAAYATIASPPTDWLASFAFVAIGTLMLGKARGLWLLHRTAWLLVVGLTGVGAAVAVIEIVRGHDDPNSWAALVWNLVTLAYLNYPSVRLLFFAEHGHAAQQGDRLRT